MKKGHCQLWRRSPTAAAAAAVFSFYQSQIATTPLLPLSRYVIWQWL
jgi:hypothetical protein